MKYRVEFPIKFDCNLRCFYCFHSDYHNNRHLYKNGRRFERKFTLAQWEQWRDRFLADASEILIMFSGGEPFIPANTRLCRELMEHCAGSIQRYEFLTNGLFNKEDVEFLDGYISKIRRIGFTYHRRMIHGKPHLIKLFYDNLQYVKNMGISVYVKELLRVEDKNAILEHRRRLKNEYGVKLKIQDYRGDNRGLDLREQRRYTAADCALVDMEYKHSAGSPCACLAGYRGIVIRGYDEYSGNVIACWHDPVVIGNIQETRFNPNFIVNVLENGQREVSGVPKKYAGTNPRDLPIDFSGSNNSGNHGITIFSTVTGRGSMGWSENRINELKIELQKANEAISQHQSEVSRLKETALRIVGAITVLEEQIQSETANREEAQPAA